MSNLRTGSTLVALIGVAFLFGCRGSAPVRDQLPAFIPREQVGSTIWLGRPLDGGLASASAIIVDDHHLLTNLHVWADGDDWWSAELAERSKRSLLFRVGPETVIGAVPFDLIAAGEREGNGPPEVVPRAERVRVDWALVRTDHPSWDAGTSAVVHPAALDPDWIVPAGTELLVVGYSGIFGRGDGPGPTELSEFVDFVRRGPYVVRGVAKVVEDCPAIDYTTDWPKPGGHSGGGVYLWDDREDRLELIGVFHSWSPSQARVTRTYAPLGLRALEFDVTSEQGTASLFYAPIAEVLLALRQSGPSGGETLFETHAPSSTP